MTRIAYAVDGRMARGSTGSGHHIRSFFRHVADLGVEIRCFDTLDGSTLDPFDRTPRSETIGSRIRRVISTIAPHSVRRPIGALGAQRRARAYLESVMAFPPESFEPLRRYQPDFLLCRMSHGNMFAREAFDQTAVPYGFECNAPILHQERRYGTLVDEDECRVRENQVLEHARFIGYVSAATKRICEETASYREVPGHVIPNCADAAFFAPLSGRTRRRADLGIDDSDTLVVFIGSFKPWHRPERLLDVLDRMPAARIKFLLLGPGATRGSLARTLRNRHADRIRLVEDVPHGDVPTYLAAADIGIQLGANEYSAPLKLIEYMAAGLAIVAPRVPPIEELLSDGHNGLLVDGAPESVAAALTALHEQPALRVRLAQQAREDAGPYTWTWNSRRYLDLVEGALGDTSGEPTSRSSELGP